VVRGIMSRKRVAAAAQAQAQAHVKQEAAALQRSEELGASKAKLDGVFAQLLTMLQVGGRRQAAGGRLYCETR
jgi:hypothetical protein